MLFKKVLPEFEIIYPKRRISWRKNGNILSLVRPLFEGYLFIETDKILEFDNLLRNLQINIAWLTSSAGSLVPIFMEEKRLIQQLIGYEGIAEVSEIEKIKDQLKVVKGPLVGLENTIKKFSGRNRRIIMEISVMGEKRKIELEGYVTNPEQIYSD